MSVATFDELAPLILDTRESARQNNPSRLVFVAVVGDVNRPSVAVFTTEPAAWNWIENVEKTEGWVFAREIRQR